VPILSQIPDEDLGGTVTKPGADGGVFVAVGHGPWGISQSLGTGKVMAEMIEREKTSANVGALGMQ
jgi:glycine/D-amino acid oxidase-like deaminating enzyme